VQDEASWGDRPDSPDSPSVLDGEDEASSAESGEEGRGEVEKWRGGGYLLQERCTRFMLYVWLCKVWVI
jgi:hypothetical protein